MDSDKSQVNSYEFSVWNRAFWCTCIWILILYLLRHSDNFFFNIGTFETSSYVAVFTFIAMIINFKIFSTTIRALELFFVHHFLVYSFKKRVLQDIETFIKIILSFIFFIWGILIFFFRNKIFCSIFVLVILAFGTFKISTFNALMVFWVLNFNLAMQAFVSCSCKSMIVIA